MNCRQEKPMSSCARWIDIAHSFFMLIHQPTAVEISEDTSQYNHCTVSEVAHSKGSFFSVIYDPKNSLYSQATFDSAYPHGLAD